MMRQVDERLRSQEQPPVDEGDFTAVEDKALLRALRHQLSRRPVATVEELCDSLDEVLLNRAQQLLEEAAEIAGAELERLPDLLAQLILDLRLEKIRRLLSEVQQLFYEAQEQGHVERLEMYKVQLQKLPLTLQRINRARWALSATSRRQAAEENVASSTG
jgi:hypothetical protein